MSPRASGQVQRPYNCTEAMRILGVSRATVLKLLRQKKLKGFKVGKVIRITRASVAALAAGR